MNTAICEKDATELLSLYMPHTAWYAIGGCTVLVILYLIGIVSFLVFYSQRPRNSITDAAIESAWRMGCIPTLLVGIFIAYLVVISFGYFYTEFGYALSYYNAMCIYPTVSGLLSHSPEALQ